MASKLELEISRSRTLRSRRASEASSLMVFVGLRGVGASSTGSRGVGGSGGGGCVRRGTGRGEGVRVVLAERLREERLESREGVLWWSGAGVVLVSRLGVTSGIIGGVAVALPPKI